MSKLVIISFPILYSIFTLAATMVDCKKINNIGNKYLKYSIIFYLLIISPILGTPNSVNGIIFIRKDSVLSGSKFPSL